MNRKMLVRAQLYFFWAMETRGLDHAHCWLRTLREVCMTLLFWCHSPPVPRGQRCLCPCGCALLHLPPWQRRCDGHGFRPRKENLDSLTLTLGLCVFRWCIWVAACQGSRSLVLLAPLLTNCKMYVYPQCPNLYSEQEAIITASWWWSTPKWWTVGPLRAPPLEVRWSQLETTS